jgi:protein-disulfide isomerase
LSITRRTFNATLAFAGLAAATSLTPLRLIDDAFAQTAAEILHPGPLGEMALGDAKAPVTIVEYASMTCPHCASFTKEVFPKLKAAYIDTGKVRFIFREFPLDDVALAASALARCVAKNDPQKYFAVIDILFKQQNELASDAHGTIFRVGKQTGFTDQMIKDCVQGDPAIQKGILEVREYAVNKLKINSTPSFFVNDTLVRGDTSFEAFQKLIDPLLKS